MDALNKMPSNAEKRRLREQYNIPNQNSSRAVRRLGYNSMADFYRDAQAREQRQERVQDIIRTGLLRSRDRARERIIQNQERENRRALFESIRQRRSGGVFDVPRPVWNESAEETHKEILRRFRGQRVTVRTTVYGPFGAPQYLTVNMRIPREGFNAWFKNEGWWKFMVSSKISMISELAEEMGIGMNKVSRVTVTVTPYVPVNSRLTSQSFAEGVKHCLLGPIGEWSLMKREESKSESAHKKYNAISNKCIAYTQKYKEGIPEKDIQEVVNDLGVGINVDLPFAHDKFIECKPHKKPLKTFNFVNSKIDHVELNEIVHTNKINEVDQKTLNDMALELKKNGKLLDFKMDNRDNFTKIRTISGTFCSPSDYLKTATEFEDLYGIGEIKIDAINDPCYEFIHEGVCINGTIDFVERWKYKYYGKCEEPKHTKYREKNFGSPPIPDIGHIDMIKAYANFDKCEQFVGFMGKPTDWRLCNVNIEFIKKNIGYYRLASLTGGSELGQRIRNKMKLYNIGEVLGTPEYIWLEQNGFEFTVSEGCWGTKFDFRFTEDMYKKQFKTSYYSKWSGINQSGVKENKYNMFGSTEYFQNMKAYANKTYKDIDLSWVSKDMVEISYPKKHSFVCPHVVGYLMCYQRLTVLNQLKKMDLDKLLRVCVDGIYYEKHEFQMLKSFDTDKEIKLGNDGGDYYMKKNSWKKYGRNLKKALENRKQPAPFRESYITELFIGAGGNGKTHYNLTDTGFVRMLYVAPAYKLTRCKELEYTVDTAVLARCLHPNYKHDIKRYNNVILFDEASQINRDTKLELFEFYGDSCKLIFCGDLGYQLPPVKGQEMGPKGFEKVTEFKQNFRFTCEKHKKICHQVRELMDCDVTKEQINEFVISQYENITEPNFYTPKDIILCSRTNCGGGVCKQERGMRNNCNCDGKNFSLGWTQKFGNTKWKCIETQSEHSNGDIVITDEKPKGKWEARHGYTIHSVQGETYEETIYIDSRQLFDSRMAYTAISRARRWEQIKIIV
jgi:hypothetical protein